MSSILDHVAPNLTAEVNGFRNLQAALDDVFAITGDAFLHTAQGIEQVSGPRIFWGAVTIGILAAGAAAAGRLTPWLIIYGLGFLLCAVYHRVKCGRFGLNGTHTESMGHTWLAYWKPGLHSFPWTFYTWAEPFLVASLGLALCLVDPVLGVWLIVVATSMRRTSTLMFKWDKKLRQELHNAGVSMDYYLGNGGWHPGATTNTTIAGRVK